jgi:N-acetylglucosamine transport system substrate-binding protein
MKHYGLLLCAALALSACSGGSSSQGGSSAPGTSGNASTAPEGPTGEGKVSGTIEVAAFKGGYDIDFYQQAAKEFDAKNGTTTTVTGGPRIWEQLRPVLAAGTPPPPDLMFPGWGMDHWALADEGQLFTLDKALDSPPAEGAGKWRDTFDPGLLKLGQKDGKQYVLPYYFSVNGWWYDPGVFSKNGWKVPKTYEELLGLCEQIKAKGLAPITFQGKYPYYMIYGMLLPWAVSEGGLQALTDAQNLAPGAWKSPAFLKAAQLIKQLNDKGDFEKGAVGLSHTESQTDFVMGKAAMIPCGTWLFSEMKKTMPPGAKMDFFIPPVPSDGKGDPTALSISIEPWMIPSGAKNAGAGIALFKYMTSLTKAKQFVQEKGTLMAIKGSDEGKLPDVLVEPDKAFKNSKTVYSYEVRYWYPAMETELENGLTSMLNNEITPEQFCDRAEAAAEKVRGDSSITKHKI